MPPQEVPSDDDSDSMEPIPPAKFCGGAIQLDCFLQHLEREFMLFPMHFPSEEHKVHYATVHLGTWAENEDPQLAKLLHEEDPSTWAYVFMKSMPRTKSVDFEAFKQAILDRFGDPTMAIQHADKAFSNYRMVKGEAVPDFKNRIHCLWNRAKFQWDDEADATAPGSIEYVLYSLAFCGMHNSIKEVIWLHLPDDSDRCASLAELFRRAERAEVYIPRARVPESTTSTTTTPTPSRGGDKSGNKKRSRGNRGGDSGAATTYSRGHKRQKTDAASLNDTRPRAPYVATEVFKARIDKGECTRCGRSGHRGSQCRTYRPAAQPRRS